MPTTEYVTNGIEYTDFTKAINTSTNYVVSGQYLLNIADAVREKTGSNHSLTINNLALAINNIDVLTSLTATIFSNNLINYSPTTHTVVTATTHTSSSQTSSYHQTQINFNISIPDDKIYIIYADIRANGDITTLNGNTATVNQGGYSEKEPFRLTTYEKNTLESSFTFLNGLNSNDLPIAIKAVNSSGGNLPLKHTLTFSENVNIKNMYVDCIVYGSSLLNQSNFSATKTYII